MIGNRIIRLDKVDSTNLYAERWLREHQEDCEMMEEDIVIISREQTAGKGQGENHWESEAGKNLTFSIILHPGFLDPSLQFQLNKAIALGVSDFVRQQLKPVRCFLKWPNDIYVNQLKLGGILIQHQVNGKILENSIVGIGLNINQSVFLPEIPEPASFSNISGKQFDTGELLPLVLKNLDFRYNQLKSGKIDKLDKDYHARLLGFGKWNRYRVGDDWIEGLMAGVDEYGQLIIRDTDGKEHFFSHGVLKFKP
ncbi:MAG: biotin--[acetyl-CoA-carboxylase] ligase [Bacteroidota bacterium]|nr:biotin--[acetyl-CoA-carboxylase] ligase [Bacteroidota bacterium]